MAEPRTPTRDAEPQPRGHTSDTLIDPPVRAETLADGSGDPAARRPTLDAGARRPPPGRLGRYAIRGELGRGGVGVVYEAWDERLERSVALKTLLAGRDATEVAVQRFLREVRASAHLRHPHIVAVHDAGCVDGCFYLAMDVIQGRPLDEVLADEGPLPPRRAVGLLLPVVRALAYAHAQGIVHRDVKPENVLLDERDEPFLTDFGLVHDLRESTARLTRTGQAVGTPAFMAPEQLHGRDVDARTDVYAVGATLYECLTGEVPFSAENYPQLINRILEEDPLPPRRRDTRIAIDIEAVVLKCLEKDPRRRYATADALAEDLERFLRGQAVQARPPSRTRRAWRLVERHRPLAAGLALALTGLGAGGGYALAVRREMARSERLRANLERDRARILAQRREALARTARDEARRAAMAQALLASSTEDQVAAWDALLEAYPEAWEGRVARARLLRRLGQERRVRGADLPGARAACLQALDDLRRAASTATEAAPLLLLEAELLRADLGDAAGARAVYEELARGTGPLAAYAQARLAHDRGDLAQVRVALARVQEERGELTPVRLLAAELLLAEGRPAEALEALDRLSADADSEAEAMLLRAQALAALTLTDDALRDARRAVELDPERPAAHLLLGRLREEVGSAARAVASYQRAADLALGDPRPRLALARLHLASADPTAAARLLAEARELGPDPGAYGDLLDGVVAAVRALGPAEGALEALERLRLPDR